MLQHNFPLLVLVRISIIKPISSGPTQGLGRPVHLSLDKARAGVLTYQTRLKFLRTVESNVRLWPLKNPIPTRR